MEKIWFSDRMVRDEKGCIRIDKRIIFDKSLINKSEIDEETIKILEKERGEKGDERKTA